MKYTFPALALGLCTSTQVLAHDIHDVSSDHWHYPNHVYTHSVSSAYDHHDAHHSDGYWYQPTPQVKTTTNTATYYSRSYPVTKTYTYQTVPNTTIHFPPFAYSSCAGRCDKSETKRIMVSSTVGSQTRTYRAPSEYDPNAKIIPTPRGKNCNGTTTKSATYVSPYQTHKLTTCTTYGCQY